LLSLGWARNQPILVIERNNVTQKMRVLIADDQRRARQSMKALLGAWYPDAELREAANGVEAIILVGEFHPDLVLMDVRMPKMDGLEGLRQIKTMRRQTRVIILSMYPEHEAEALAAGADAFVSKSDPPEKLRETLAGITGELN